MKQSFIAAAKTVVQVLSITDLEVLTALSESPNQSTSAGELCDIFGFSAVVQVNSAMGRVGRKICAEIGAHPDDPIAGEFEWCRVLATGVATDGRGFVWKMRNEVVAELVECGYSTIGKSSPTSQITDACNVDQDLTTKPPSASQGEGPLWTKRRRLRMTGSRQPIWLQIPVRG
jgi:hypothetical protein